MKYKTKVDGYNVMFMPEEKTPNGLKLRSYISIGGYIFYKEELQRMLIQKKLTKEDLEQLLSYFK